jgi:hypothetical protein
MREGKTWHPCSDCDTLLPPHARFCAECGADQGLPSRTGDSQRINQYRQPSCDKSEPTVLMQWPRRGETSIPDVATPAYEAPLFRNETGAFEEAVRAYEEDGWLLEQKFDNRVLLTSVDGLTHVQVTVRPKSRVPSLEVATARYLEHGWFLELTRDGQAVVATPDKSQRVYLTTVTEGVLFERVFSSPPSTTVTRPWERALHTKRRPLVRLNVPLKRRST